MSTFSICTTCAVEYALPAPQVCPICAEERENMVPATGQQWTDLQQLRAQGQELTWSEPESDRAQIGTDPALGIGQTAQLVTTAAGSLLWDPPGYLDDHILTRIRARGPVLAVAASHPHMFGVQLAWAEALDAPVLVCAADEQWLGRRSDRIQFYTESHRLTSGLSIHRIGGHFPGSAIVHWADGADGRGVILCGDTVFPNPDQETVAFLRSYPNNIPLSAAVVRGMADRLAQFSFDRLVGNFANTIDADARRSVARSAERYIAWVSGAHDEQTGVLSSPFGHAGP